jgi:hypothetical protein
MAQHSRSAFLGVLDPEDAATARSFFAFCNSSGISRARALEMKRWWDAYPKHGPIQLEKLVPAFAAHFSQEAEAVAGWFDTVDEQGADAIPADPAPSSEQDEKRRAEIDKLMREDPHNWAKDPWLEQEALDIEQRRIDATPSKSAPLNVGEEVNALGAHAPKARDRAAEIAEIMKNDFGRYFADRDLQQEYAALSGASAWGPAPTSSPAPEPTQQGDHSSEEIQ